MRVGVLALQGDFALHARALAKCGVEAVEVRKPAELDAVEGLIIPGGESTTLLKLMDAWDFAPAIEKFHGSGKSIFGTCAGLILLAREVESPRQFSLGLIDVSVERNAYGRQLESSIRQGQTSIGADARKVVPLEMVFIRAPKIERVGEGVEVLAREGNDPVLVRKGKVMAATFHPELSADTRVHQAFLNLVNNGSESLHN